ncbi:MAG: HlyD family secretion protein [Sphingomonadaceae bacterium]|nr:HlyD family secretion protein [Sphingomonadaceae bacterium]
MADADPAFDTDEETHTDTDTGESSTLQSSRWRGRIVVFAVPIAVVLIGGYFWFSLLGQVSTDNAYLQQDKVAVGAEVSGPIVEIMVSSGQDVNKGDVLFRLDPTPYALQIKQADAAIASAQANVTALANSTELSGVDIAAAREDIAFAQANFSRQRALWGRGFTTKADYEAAQHAVAQAQEAMRQAQAEQREARAKLATGAAVPGQNPQVAAARARRESTQHNFERATVRAPISGRVAQVDRLQLGQQVITGLPVVTIVSTDSSYVEANFKETDLADMRIGQPAEIEFDAYPELTLNGHVASIGAGTGSEFSILPAQNATGNWVKVTQRVPVRIAIDDESSRQMIAGLSTHVTVYTDGRKR